MVQTASDRDDKFPFLLAMMKQAFWWNHLAIPK